jgi:hypothetical protein
MSRLPQSGQLSAFPRWQVVQLRQKLGVVSNGVTSGSPGIGAAIRSRSAVNSRTPFAHRILVLCTPRVGIATPIPAGASADVCSPLVCRHGCVSRVQSSMRRRSLTSRKYVTDTAAFSCLRGIPSRRFAPRAAKKRGAHAAASLRCVFQCWEPRSGGRMEADDSPTKACAR